MSESKTPRMAPVQGYVQGIPWEMHLRAYNVYCSKYGPQKALLEGWCRGGFSTGELDMFIPGWRDELEELPRVRKELLIAQQTISQLRLDIASIREQHQREWNEFDRNENDADALKQTIAQQAGQIQGLRSCLQNFKDKLAEAGEDYENGDEDKAVEILAYLEADIHKALSTPAPVAVVPCAWRQDEDGNWNTACGEIFCYNDGGPKENKTNFCQYCGKPVQAITYAPAQGEKGQVNQEFNCPPKNKGPYCD